MRQNSAGGDTAKTHKSLKDDQPVVGRDSSIAAIVTTAAPPSDPKQVATAVPSVSPETQWWYRKPDAPLRKIVDRICALKRQGKTPAEIGKKLDIGRETVNNHMYIARKNGWLDDNDEPIEIEEDLKRTVDRKIVRNIDASLDGHMTNWQTHEMTIAAAKGRGIFKNHDVVKQDGPAVFAPVAIQVIMPAVGAADQTVNEANIGGTPAYVEAEVSNEEIGGTPDCNGHRLLLGSGGDGECSDAETR